MSSDIPNRSGGKTLMDRLYTVALAVGIDSNNPEGGVNHDSADDDIIEVICDIARGNPFNLPIHMDRLTEYQRATVLRAFYDGAYDR
jgi:hypothetical protein